MQCSISVLSNMIATSHTSTRNMVGVTHELNFKFYLILINLNVESHIANGGHNGHSRVDKENPKG